MKTKNYSDWVVALSVVACSALLFAALALALSGTMISKPAHTVRVNFHDVTGVSLGARVKYAGALAGKVSAIRILTNEERVASGDPLNAVEITLALDKGFWPLAADTKASVAADTLLSDKFVLLGGGTVLDKDLAENAVIQGIAPITFDKLARDIDGAIDGLRGMLGGANDGSTSDIFARVKVLLEDTQTVINEAKPVLQDAKALASDGRQLASDARQMLADNKTQINSAITRMNNAAGSFEQIGTRGNNFLATNDKKLTGMISDFKITSENLKITSTYAKILMRNVNLKPSQLLWGTAKPPTLPSELEILQAQKMIPIPSN